MNTLSANSNHFCLSLADMYTLVFFFVICSPNMKAGDTLDGCQSSNTADLYDVGYVMVPKLVPESTGPRDVDC